MSNIEYISGSTSDPDIEPLYDGQAFVPDREPRDHQVYDPDTPY